MIVASLSHCKSAIVDHLLLAQHESPNWMDGHLTVPKEQYTQQSPLLGSSTVLQNEHS